MNRFRASIMGGSGYAGGEMIRRLLLHPQVELARVASVDHVGEPLSHVHLNLEGQTDLKFENLTPSETARGVDVVLLSLPSKVTATKVPELLQTGVKIIDLSGDFRISDKDRYAQCYGSEHPQPELLQQRLFTYGLPEWNRDNIRTSRAVASPGCFATAIELGLLPLARAGLLQGDVQTVAMTGSSGSGVAPSAGTHHPVRSQNLRTYKPLSHQHVPETEELLTSAGARAIRIHFVPVSAPLSRGIFATSFAHISVDTDVAEVANAYTNAYKDEPFVRIPKVRLPELIAVAGSNYAEVGFHIGPAQGATRLVTCFSTLDNLIKGGAGQVIQNMNLILGLDERLSLQDPGAYP